MKKFIDALLNRKKYKTLNWWENFMGGHVNIGNMTIYGENAMHWGITFWTNRWGYICFRLPLRCFGCWWHLYFYTSPVATPWASTFYRGPEKRQIKKAAERRSKYGFRYNTDVLFPDLYPDAKA